MRFFIAQLLAIEAVLAVKIQVSPSGGNATSPIQYGLMFEEINHSGDGGLYAELIRNRALQGVFDPEQPTVEPSLEGFSSSNGVALSVGHDEFPLSDAIPNYLTVGIPANGSPDPVGFANAGWWGIDVQVQNYTGSFFVRGAYNGTFRATLESAETGQTFGEVAIPSTSQDGQWTRHDFTLTPTEAAENANNTFSIVFDPSGADGPLNFTLISLFPPTYNDRPNGLRKDLVEALSDLQPKFLRFPGGGNLNGISENTQYKWNDTIGTLEERPGRVSVWGYYETDGLGLVEYMQLCEDLVMEPLLVLWSGLNFVDGPLSPEALEPYVQDALNQIEFLTGPADSTHGSLRAALGHPEPWRLRYVQIGNEDNLTGGLESYEAYRLRMFHDALRAAYPDLTILASASEFTMAPSAFPAADVGGDFHRYTVPDGFVGEHFGTFDHITHPTLIGEMACVYPNNPNGSSPGFADYVEASFWIGSVAEAVFLLGAERNSGDRVLGAAYAPLLAHAAGTQWAPTLLAYDGDPARTTRSTSFHVLRLLGSHTMTETLPAATEDGEAGFNPLYYVAGRDDAVGSYLFKAAVYNSTDGADVPVSVRFEGSDIAEGAPAQLTVLTAADPMASNGMGREDVVTTTETTLTAGADGTFAFALPNLSVAILVAEGYKTN